MHERTKSLSGIEIGDALAALESWNLSGTAAELPGERDRNFRVRAQDGRSFVLKFCADRANPAVLDLQSAALAHLAAGACAAYVPRVVPPAGGGMHAAYARDGESHVIRLTTWLGGEPLSAWRPRTPGLLRDIGQCLGAITASLAAFHHPAARRDLKWDLARAAWICDAAGVLAEPALHARVGRIAAEFDERVAPALAQCRRSIVHNDANDHNILVRADVDGDGRVSGVIDFGDLIETHTVCDLAIALAYAMMDAPDPLSAGALVVEGYHRAFPLQEHEIELLFPLARTRLAVSLVNAAMEAQASPGNAYLQVSVTGAARLLERLDEEHGRYATCRFRAACGLEPCAASAPVRAWLSAHRGEFRPVCEHPLDSKGVYVHDYSVASTEIGTMDVWQDQARFTQHVADVVRDANAAVGLARYDEVRAIYTNDLFRVTGNDGPEWRTVHLGIDVNLPVGAQVFAPLAGVVHSVRDNQTPGDYGPTVVLEHRVERGALTFWTLYGHLDREVLARLQPGSAIEAGAVVGLIGDRNVNGGWWPHVHVQIICDLLDRSGDFAGVARPVDRNAWLSLSPDPANLLRAPASSRAPRPPDAAALVAQRASVIGPSLSVSYRRPLHIVRGMMQTLIADDGRRYLDCVNNVAHVGHAHPDVVRAGQRQMAALNTNTRYLHELLAEYAGRLTATLPGDLSVCYFVCSGSEANELALRLARAYTGARDTVVLQTGYHGNTTTLIDVSSYKFDGVGGTGPPQWVHVIPTPDTYRGPYRNRDSGRLYAQHAHAAVDRITSTGKRPAAFLAESILSCAGQIALPTGYLADVYPRVRAAGGVCIADEVQVGFGRAGSHMWAFETQGVVPDIVTMGKPIGNGHPLGAVVTTPAIAAAFANGMEYFNTFGGNPASCAIGLSVLDVIERENLQERAHRVGSRLITSLGALAASHALIGDVRGLGLFIGVELVTNHETLAPATAQARYVANRMRDLGVLVSTDGPANNVLKIKPPMCFGEDDADQLVTALDRVLGEHPAQP